LTHFRTEYEAFFITSSNNLLFPLKGGNDSIDRFEAKRKMTMWGIGTYFNRIDGLFEKLNNVHGNPSGYNQALCACMVTDA